MATFFESTSTVGISGNFSSSDPAITYQEDGLTFVITVNSGDPLIRVNPSEIFISAGATSASVSIDFEFASAPATLAGAMAQFSDLANVPVFGAIFFTGGGTGLTLTIPRTVDVSGSLVTGIQFTLGVGQTVSLEQLTATSVCFLPGTAMMTEDGPKPIEDLEPGDVLRTADGGSTRVQWLGRQTIDTRFRPPETIFPICISAGTLGNDRDLFVSPDHGVFVDGYLVNASALVNGESIYQVSQMPKSFTYYHVETDAHELILAEGCPVESFFDYAGLDRFDNAGERVERLTQEMDLPRVSKACAQVKAA